MQLIREGEDFDVAILDLQMPVMDGQILAKVIRRFCDPGALPLISLTPINRQEEGRHANFAAVLTKPVKFSQLYAVLVGVFSGQAAPIQKEPAKLHIDPHAGQRHPLRILLAEDNAVNQKVALHLLGRSGYRADVASNGLEALEALEQQAYDVVLMDVQMPQMDGLQATRRIREQWPDGQGPRIIAMTANAMQGDRKKCLDAGMDDYISKPVRVADLISALEKCRPSPQRPKDPMSEQLPTPSRDSLLGPPRETHRTVPVNGRSANSAIDGQVFENLHHNLGEAVIDLITVYLDNSTKLVAEMREASVQESVDTLHISAHTLKSSSALVGAIALSSLCEELETMARAQELDDIVQKVEQVEAEYQRVEETLSASCSVSLPTVLDAAKGTNPAHL
jgi:CheY-like chemotaxis protein/HPt (histidine-containing phosphotransfer) domain-containing protein